MGRVEGQVARKSLAPEDLEYRALTLRALGWLLLVLDAIVVVFIFVGIRTGSLMWLYWAVIEGVVGIVLVAAGLRAEQIANAASGHAAKPHLNVSDDAEHPKAA